MRFLRFEVIPLAVMRLAVSIFEISFVIENRFRFPWLPVALPVLQLFARLRLTIAGG